MAILVTCRCRQQFQTRDENAGRSTKCPECGRDLVVPDAIGWDAQIPGSRATVMSGKAVASVILGIGSIFTFVLSGIPAIIVAWFGLKDIARGQGRLTGRGMATTGMVLGVVGPLLFVVLFGGPLVSSTRENLHQRECVNNLKQIGLALHNYHGVENTFPALASTDNKGRPLLSWRVAILPQLGEGLLYTKFHLDEPWDSPHNLSLVSQMPAVYACPSDVNLKKGKTGYQAIVASMSIFPPDFKPTRIQDITDGTSNTILVGESTTGVPWTSPQDSPFDGSVSLINLVGSAHPGGFNALFADGAVKFLNDTVAGGVLTSLVSRAGGEVISSSSY